jgi:hypothetical protein
VVRPGLESSVSADAFTGAHAETLHAETHAFAGIEVTAIYLSYQLLFALLEVTWIGNKFFVPYLEAHAECRAETDAKSRKAIPDTSEGVECPIIAARSDHPNCCKLLNVRSDGRYTATSQLWRFGPNADQV